MNEQMPILWTPEDFFAAGDYQLDQAKKDNAKPLRLDAAQLYAIGLQLATTDTQNSSISDKTFENINNTFNNERQKAKDRLRDCKRAIDHLHTKFTKKKSSRQKDKSREESKHESRAQTSSAIDWTAALATPPDNDESSSASTSEKKAAEFLRPPPLPAKFLKNTVTGSASTPKPSASTSSNPSVRTVAPAKPFLGEQLPLPPSKLRDITSAGTLGLPKPPARRSGRRRVPPSFFKKPLSVETKQPESQKNGTGNSNKAT